MKKRIFLTLLLFASHCLHSQMFVRNLEETNTTFDFSVSCSQYNSFHQVAWLAAGEKVVGDQASYSLSCARHATLEGRNENGEARLIILPRALEKTYYFANAPKAPGDKKEDKKIVGQLDVDNPIRGKASRLMVLHETFPIIVLEENSHTLYMLSEILRKDENQTENKSSISAFHFDENEYIHHMVSHAGNLYVFHSNKGTEFGEDESSRVTVLSITPDRISHKVGFETDENGETIKDSNGIPKEKVNYFMIHAFNPIASKVIKKSDSVLVAGSHKPLLSLGSKIKTVVHAHRLYAVFAVQAAQGGFACGLVQISLQKKEKKKTVKNSVNDKVTSSNEKSGDKTLEGPSESTQDVETQSSSNSDLEKSQSSEKAVSQKSIDSEDSQKENLSIEVIEVSGQNSSHEKQVTVPKVDETDDTEQIEEKTFKINYEDLGLEVIFTSCVPNEAVDKEELLFYVANGRSLDVSNISTMATSTAMDYLVAASGHHIFVCPLDEEGKIISHGVVEDFYTDPNFISRSHKLGGATSFVRSFDVQYIVENFQIVGDTIYIKHKNLPGIYSYRALFNVDGSIDGWCTSEHFAQDQKIDYFYISNQKAFAWYVSSKGDVASLYQTTWEKDSDLMSEFVQAVDQVLPRELYGVQGMFSLVSNELQGKKDWVVATGYNHAVYGLIYQNNGAPVSVDAQVANVPDAGALVAAEIVRSVDEKQEWLMLGGVGGLYGYAEDDGSGFEVVENLDSVFTEDSSWKKIGNFSFVRKIVYDRKNPYCMYVVAHKGVYKVTINKQMFSEPCIENVFDTAVLGGRFDFVSDVFIDDEFVLVGTSKGLYAIEDMNNPSSVYKVELDGNVKSVSKITALKGSKDFDNIYVLSQDQCKQLSSLYRVVLRNKKCELFADCIYKNKQTDKHGVRRAFLEMNTTTSDLFSNGSWYVKMNYPYKKESEAIMCYSSGLHSGINTVRNANRNYLRNMYLTCVRGSQNIGGMVHNSALGCWMMFGDFGLRLLIS